MSELAASARELESAVLETILYSDLFDYPLTCDEVSHYLFGLAANRAAVCAFLESLPISDGKLAQRDGFVFMRGRDEIVDRRRTRQMTSARLWIRARRFVRVLAALPFVRMVGVTGALAMDNSEAGDDIDVLIVTSRGRAWTARLLSVALVYVGKILGDVLCPNYLITEDALELEARDLFAAHEFAQMTPVYGLDVYDRMQCANGWVYGYLPNAHVPFRREVEIRPGLLSRTFKRLAEWLLGGVLGDRLEDWEMRRKLRKFAPKITSASSAILDRDHVKGHFEDYAAPVLQAYGKRLTQYGLDGSRLRVASRSPVALPVSSPGVETRENVALRRASSESTS